jgi:probable addiction module antidote protein
MVELTKINGETCLINTLREKANLIGVTELSRQSGVSRVQLYEILSNKSNPRLSTVIKILRALKLDVLIG